MSYKECGRNVVHKIHKKLLKNCIYLHIQMLPWRLLELALAQEIEARKATDFYHFSGIHMSGFKGSNILQIHKRYELSFWSKKKDYSIFWTRQYSVFTTDCYSNRGLRIHIQSVWYIYYIGLYETGSREFHFLLTR